jgi:hypothetical protein
MVEKKRKYSTKKGLICPHINIKITKNENLIFDLLTNKFLTISQIASMRGVSPQAVYKTRASLKKKGLLRNVGKGVENFESTPDKNRFRLHGQEWNIKIISKSKKYGLAMRKGNAVQLENSTIRLYENSIEIYSNQSFWGRNEQEATRTSLIYWQRFFIKLENKYNLLLLKEGKNNISLVNQHFAEIDSEIAKDYLKRREALSLIAKEDGKRWFTLDNSFGFKERECLHPKTSKQDSEKVSKQINDWRNYDPPTNSQLSIAIIQVTNNQKEIQSSDLEYRENIRSHIKAIQELGSGVRQLVKLVSELKGR